MTDLQQYVDINRHFMTSAEMAGEAGVDRQQVTRLLAKNGWTAISPSDRIRDYLKAHPTSILEDVAERFNRVPSQVFALAKELGITLPTRKRSEKKAIRKLLEDK